MADGILGCTPVQLDWYQAHKQRWVAHLLRTGVTEIVLDSQCFQRSIADVSARWYRQKLSADTFLWDGVLVVRNADSLDPSDPCWGGRAFAGEIAS